MREHPAEAPETIGVPLKESAQRNFGIAMGTKPVPKAFEFAPQFPEVVDFAVIDDGRVSVVAEHRLVAACSVDDLQAHRAERNVRATSSTPAGPARDASAKPSFAR